MIKLIPTRIPIKVGDKYIVVLNENSAQKLDLHAGDRVLIKNGKKAEIRALLDVTENGEIRDTQIGLYIETWEKLKAKRGDRLSISVAEKPISILYIKDKLKGKKLTKEQIDEIIKDVVEEDLSDVEISYFVAACYINKLSEEETVNLTKSIVEHGSTLKFDKKIVVDKHCIGGVAGNRTTMIAVPILTALGLTMPKTSSRAITSPAGTADTMEVLCNVTVPGPKLQEIADKVGGFIAWGGGVDLAAADDKMIRARHPLSLDPEGMLLASIMAKKHSVSSTHVLIDIPVGKQTKIKTRAEGKRLAKKFTSLGKKLGMVVEVMLSKGEEPVGNGVGPILEAIDVMKVLKDKKDAPQDLKQKGIEMSGQLLELCGKAKRGKGEAIARKVLESGLAYKQMMRIIKAQGESKIKLIPGKYTMDILAKKSGKITGLNNRLISHIARTAGAPKDKGAGVYIHKKLKDTVKAGEVLYTIHADVEERLKYSEEYKINEVYTIK
ncbi:MAG: AMP phosphorylase [Candidatus Gracilibacteria bacterium]|nr:AMP phosphorylase [Candidatus Gracilibacteria bacterium]